MAEDDWTERLPEAAREYLEGHRLDEVECVIADLPGIARGKAVPAAKTAFAALQQGKFWEMAEIVFANQTALEDDDLLAYAKTIGLNVPQFRADLEAGKGKERVEGDRADGEKLEITGTPAVFINGRYFNDLLFGGTVAGWVEDALRR